MHKAEAPTVPLSLNDLTHAVASTSLRRKCSKSSQAEIASCTAYLRWIHSIRPTQQSKCVVHVSALTPPSDEMNRERPKSVQVRMVK